MANTYTQIHIQAIFAVKKRTGLIQNNWKDELYKYITAIVQAPGHRLLAINGMPDHLHVFFGMRPIQSLSELMQNIKQDSSGWINRKKFTSERFEWQEGFGAFSYSKSQVSRVIRYVQNQENHHRTITFLDEYQSFLEKFGVDYMNDIFLRYLNNNLLNPARLFNVFQAEGFFLPALITEPVVPAVL